MLVEFPGVSQHRDSFRQLFTDEYFDLYVWYDRKGGSIIGIQLCYDTEYDPHALTWMATGLSVHSKIDDGEGKPGAFKGSPILVSDGLYDCLTLEERFVRAAANLDTGLRDLVIARIREHRD